MIANLITYLYDYGHSLQRRVKEVLLDLCNAASETTRHTRTVTRLLKLYAFKTLLFKWVTDQVTFSHGKSMATSDYDSAILVSLKHIVWWDDSLLLVLRLANCSYSLDYKVVLCQRACLIKTTNSYFASKGYSKRLSTKDLLLYQLHNTIVYGHT